MKNILIAIAILFAFFWIIGKLTSTNSNSKSTADTTVSRASIDSSLTESIDNSSSWNYSEDEDKMTSQKTFYASIESNDILNFNFPYDGGSIPSMVIRKKRGSTDIMIRVTKGQFTSDYDNEHVKIRFGNSSPKNYSYSKASDGSSDVIFIDDISRMLKNLKKFDKMIVEAEFYNNGLNQMEFNISDFKWNH